MIQSKEQIIEYFKSGAKDTNNFKIGIEHEKFLFYNNKNCNLVQKVRNNKELSFSKEQ